MPRRAQNPTIEQFLGIYDKSDQEVVPAGHFITSHNVEFYPSGVRRRRSTSSSLLLSGNPIVKIGQYFDQIYGVHTFSLDNVGNIYQDGTLLMNLAYSTGGNPPTFKVMQFLNKLFFAFPRKADASSALPVYLYDPVYNVFRPACGQAPYNAGPMTAALGSGNMSAGPHQFAVCYETQTGFLTPIGPLTPSGLHNVFNPTLTTVASTNSVTLSNIPKDNNVPSYVVARHILGTKSNDPEFFFIPNAIIQDNTTTTFNVNYYDTDLVESANYLFNVGPVIYGELPFIYGDRIGYLRAVIPSGSYNVLPYVQFTDVYSNSQAALSESGDAETFNGQKDYIVVSKDDGLPLNGAAVLRRTLYFFKEKGVHASTDNGGDPNTWDVDPISDSLGAIYGGIGETIKHKNIVDVDSIVVADSTRMYNFSGIPIDPALSWKISNLWHNAYPSFAIGFSIIVDSNLKMLWAGPALINGENVILMASFDEGLDYKKIKWDIWKLPQAIVDMGFFSPTYAVPPPYFLSNNNVLQLATIVDSPDADYDGSLIDSYIKFAKIALGDGAVMTVSEGLLQVNGNGPLTLDLWGIDDADENSLYSLDLPSAFGQMIAVPAGFSDEFAAPRLEINTLNSWFKLRKIELTTALYSMRRPK